MRVTYDETADAAYIYLRDGRPVSRTERVDDATFVDLDTAGEMVGIEILTPARDWGLDEIASRYAMSLTDVLEIRALWPENGVFPFAPVAQPVGAASSG